MRISIWSIPHKKQRYDTVGDWRFRGKELLITVSRMKNPDYIFLVALHELVEAWLCFRRGIRERDITKFDKEYERNRKDGDFSELGDSQNAPYRREHKFATKIERQMAKELRVDWNEYDQTVNSL
jgi:hypothetical protein